MEWSFLTGVCGNGQLPAYFLTKDIYFTDSIKATILYALLAVVGAIIYSLLVALLLNMKIWGRTIFRSIFFIPYLLPAIGVYKGWQWLYEGNFGLFNFVLRMLGMKPQRFLDSPSQVVPSLVVIAIWTSGNLIVVFLAGLQNVPRVYMEAAEIDGANAWQRFWNVTIPSISPIIFYNVLTALITHLQVINPALALTDGGPGKKCPCLCLMSFIFMHLRKISWDMLPLIRLFSLSWLEFFTAVLFKTQKELDFGGGNEKWLEKWQAESEKKSL